MQTHGEVSRSCAPSPSRDYWRLPYACPVLRPRKATCVPHVGVMGHFVLRVLRGRTQAQRKLTGSFKIQTNSRNFLETASWVTSSDAGPSTHWSPHVHCPLPPCGSVHTAHKTRSAHPSCTHCCFMASEWGQSSRNPRNPGFLSMCLYLMNAAPQQSSQGCPVQGAVYFKVSTLVPSRAAAPYRPEGGVRDGG